MTDLRYSHTTRVVRDAVVAWLDTDPTMASLGQDADARALEAAHDRLLPMLAAALWTSRGVDPNVLADIGDAERLVRPEDRADSRTHLLALKEIVRAHPDTNAARLLAYHEAVALMQGGEPGSVEASGFDLVDALRPLAASVLWQSHRDLSRRYEERNRNTEKTVADLRDHLSRETKSAEAASAIADELSVALEASRALVTDRDDHLLAIRAALGCDDGATTIVAEITRLREACALTVVDLDEANKTILALRDQLQTAHRDAEDLRDRMADPEGMSHALRVHPLEDR